MSFYRDRLVLVTGGSGFIGTHLVQELLKDGARVRVPLHKRPLTVPDERIEAVQSDLTRLEDCLAATEGVDYVFHAAGAVAGAGVSTNAAMAAITANLVLTAQMLQAAWSGGAKGFLLFSSSTGYPAADYPVKEEDFWSGPTHPSYLGYGWMRRYFEKLGEFAASKSGMKLAIVRPTAVYGPWDNFDLSAGHVIPALIRKAVERLHPYEVWGSGAEVRDFLHVTDLVRGCLLMLEKSESCDPINLGYGRPVTIGETVRIILRAADYSEAKVQFNTSKPAVLPCRMTDTTKAKTLLGFVPQISLEDGLRETVQWFRDRGRT